MSPDLAILVTALLVSSAAALLGCFLVLRRQALISDAISHSVLPGIVLAFWLSGGERATVPALLGAALAGLVTVTLVEWLTSSGKVKNDAAIGIVFPALFSLGVLFVSLYFRNVHLDLDAVLYGEIAYTPLNLVQIGGVQFPESWGLMGGILALNLLFVTLFYKELKLSTFDRGLAAALGFVPAALHYALMTLVSVTAVGAFQSVGAILIVAFIVIPPATAFLLTPQLSRMLPLSVLIGAASSVLGYVLALWMDASIAGAISSVLGLVFAAVLLLGPQGVLMQVRRRSGQKLEFSARLLVAHLSHHDRAVPESEVLEEFGWNRSFLERVRAQAERSGWVQREPSGLHVTATAGQALEGLGLPR